MPWGVRCPDDHAAGMRKMAGGGLCRWCGADRGGSLGEGTRARAGEGPGPRGLTVGTRELGSGAVLTSTGAAGHVGPINIQINQKVRVKTALKVSVVPQGQWLPVWTVQMKTISISTEGSTGQSFSKQEPSGMRGPLGSPCRRPRENGLVFAALWWRQEFLRLCSVCVLSGVGVSSPSPRTSRKP